VRPPPYPKYRTSGIEWLRDVPAHWQVKRLKTVASYRVSNVDKIPSEDEVSVRLCNYTDVYYNEFIWSEMGLMETTATPEEVKRFWLREGDVVITKDSEEWSDIAVPALIVETAPDLVCGYHLAMIRPALRELLGPFLLRLLQSPAVNQQFQLAATGVTRYGLPKSAIGDAWLPLPPVREQHAIADFLSAATAKIDRLVQGKGALIEKLREKRAALISQTVARGLPPDAARAAGLSPHPKLKRSGIDWIGNIPEHWEVAQLRRKWTILDCKHRTVQFVDDGIPVASIGAVQRFQVDLSNAKFTTEAEFLLMIEGGRRPRVGDIIYSRNATVGAAALVSFDERFCMGQDVCLIRSAQVIDRYTLYLLKSSILAEQLEAVMIGSTFRRINVGEIKKFWVCVPPRSEQALIISFLDGETDRLDRMIAKVEEAIARLQEYRTALITAAVTGKIDLREGIPASEPAMLVAAG
jgi:type I restriction enzyme, S subunit